jgi:hypothetical protein
VCVPPDQRSSTLLLLTLGFATVAFLVVQFGFGVDSTRTLEIGAVCKAIGIFVYAPVALFAHCWCLFRDTDSPNGDGSRLRLKYPNYWMLVGAAKAALIVAAIVTFGLQICAMLAPRIHGQVEYSIAKVHAVRDSAEVMSPRGLQLNCSRYIEVELSNAQTRWLCYRRRREADALSIVEPAPGDYVSLQTRSNVLGTFVESLTPASSLSQ